jgi:hypothetical protein
MTGTNQILLPLHSQIASYYDVLHKSGVSTPLPVTVTYAGSTPTDNEMWDGARSVVEATFSGYTPDTTVSSTSYWNGSVWANPLPKQIARGFSIKNSATSVAIGAGIAIYDKTTSSTINLPCDFVALIQATLP